MSPMFADMRRGAGNPAPRAFGTESAVAGVTARTRSVDADGGLAAVALSEDRDVVQRNPDERADVLDGVADLDRQHLVDAVSAAVAVATVPAPAPVPVLGLAGGRADAARARRAAG